MSQDVSQDVSQGERQGACPRLAAAERDGRLAAALDELVADEAHLATCADCRAALAGYQRLARGLAELAAAAPRRRADHVARALATAAAEPAAAAAAAVAAVTAPAAAPVPGQAEVTPLRPRRRAALVLAPLAALAAAAALLLWLRRDGATPAPPPVRFAFEVVAQGGPTLRGEAQLGDELRVTLPPGSALWIYRNDRELLLVCPRDCRRSSDGAALIASRALDGIGRYQLVWLSTAEVPAPRGELQADIAAARAAGARHELRELDIE